jgi:hypothetical protein
MLYNNTAVGRKAVLRHGKKKRCVLYITEPIVTAVGFVAANFFDGSPRIQNFRNNFFGFFYKKKSKPEST